MSHSTAPSMPICDYADHPAFRRYRRTSSDDAEAAVHTAAIESAFDAVVSAPTNTSALLWHASTAGHWQYLLQSIGKWPHLSEATRTRCTKAVTQARHEMSSMVDYICSEKDFIDPADTASTRIYEQLSQDGVAVNRVPDSTIGTLRSQLRDEIEYVRKLAERDPWNRRMLPMRLLGSAWDTTWAALNESGVVGGISKYESRCVKPMNWSLALNTPTETWYRDCYADVGVPTSPAAYMHYDHDFNFAKIQIYLTDVDLDSAPFSYIPGSHRWRGSTLQQMIFKTMDSAFSDVPRPAGESYYRLRFRIPEQREQFMLLPPWFRGTSHFGDDVLADSALANQLLPLERFVTSDVGNCMVFTGGKALHRGGLARTKERLVLQVGVSAVPPASWALQPKTLRQSAAEQAGRIARLFLGDRVVSRAGRLIRTITG